MTDPTPQQLIQLREDARDRLSDLRAVFLSLGLSERDVARSQAFCDIACSLPTSQLQWLVFLQQGNICYQERLKAEAEAARNSQQSQNSFFMEN